MEDQNNINILIQKISSAFQDVKYPGDKNLINQSYGDEPILVRDHFASKNDWTKLSAEYLDFDGALSFFSDEAFRYYLPAFMIADINEQLSLNDPTVKLCWLVTPQSENKKIAEIWGGGTIGERAKTCFDGFSKEQVSAIVAYLNWRLVKDKYNPTIEQALENYWLKQ